MGGGGDCLLVKSVVLDRVAHAELQTERPAYFCTEDEIAFWWNESHMQALGLACSNAYGLVIDRARTLECSASIDSVKLGISGDTLKRSRLRLVSLL